MTRCPFCKEIFIFIETHRCGKALKITKSKCLLISNSHTWSIEVNDQKYRKKKIKLQDGIKTSKKEKSMPDHFKFLLPKPIYTKS